jgi:putative FmdB family regulatory protein
MPIYEYRCSSCGFQNEYLQRVSDPLLTQCPECGKATFNKMVTAAGFHLKGSGWYVTDFKNGAAKPKAGKEKSAENAADTPSEGKKEEKKDEKKAEPASGSSTTPAGS